MTVSVKQPREANGRFDEKPPVDERGFFGKLRALFSGEMGMYMAECQAECKRGQEKAQRALRKERKSNRKGAK